MSVPRNRIIARQHKVIVGQGDGDDDDNGEELDYKDDNGSAKTRS